MPQIIVTAGSARDPRTGDILLRERVNASDFESERFVTNLLERLGWAVEDATALELRDETWELDDDAEAVAAEPIEPQPELEPDPAPVGVA